MKPSKKKLARSWIWIEQEENIMTQTRDFFFISETPWKQRVHKLFIDSNFLVSKKRKETQINISPFAAALLAALLSHNH